jgi:hypothetical protein
MKLGLSNHQSVCNPLMTLNCLVDFHEIWYGGNAIQGDLNAIIFNPFYAHSDDQVLLAKYEDDIQYTIWTE